MNQGLLIKAFKFKFDIKIQKVKLNIAFPCNISVQLKRGTTKIITKNKVNIDKQITTAIFDENISLECSMYIDQEKMLYLEKKTSFTILLNTSKGSKVAGVCSYDLSQLLNQKQKDANVEMNLLKCPDKEAKIYLNVAAECLQEIGNVDNMSQMTGVEERPSVSQVACITTLPESRTKNTLEDKKAMPQVKEQAKAEFKDQVKEIDVKNIKTVQTPEKLTSNSQDQQLIQKLQEQLLQEKTTVQQYNEKFETQSKALKQFNELLNKLNKEKVQIKQTISSQLQKEIDALQISNKELEEQIQKEQQEKNEIENVCNEELKNAHDQQQILQEENESNQKKLEKAVKHNKQYKEKLVDFQESYQSMQDELIKSKQKLGDVLNIAQTLDTKTFNKFQQIIMN